MENITLNAAHTKSLKLFDLFSIRKESYFDEIGTDAGV